MTVSNLILLTKEKKYKFGTPCRIAIEASCNRF